MSREHRRVMTRNELERLSMYLECVKGYNVDFFNRLINLDRINFSELDLDESIIKTIFIKEALIYNIYYNSLMMLAEDKEHLEISQNFFKKEDELNYDNYYLTASLKENDNIFYDFICPADYRERPLSINLYSSIDTEMNEFNKKIMDYYRLHFDEIESDSKDCKMLIKKYPQNNPVLVVKSSIKY